ncbi:MAG: hypothetical protein AB1644_06770 [Candidatus Zixiibacteriota bacterium]
MRLRIVIALLAIVAGGSRTCAAPGVEAALSVYQWDRAEHRPVLLYTDTARFVQGIRAVGVLTCFSVELEFTKIDSSSCSFTTHVITLGQSPQTFSRRFTTEFGLPARVDSIGAKAGGQYALSISPLKRISIDTSACPYVHYRKDDFDFDPTTNTDLYFVPKSFGDYYWNQVKSIIEERYSLFRSLNNFSLPGKCAIYLCPCRLPSIIWDTRFGMMVDPTRNAVFAIYNKSFNSADPFIVNQAALLRNYGYAPAFLSEGFANYLTLANHDMIELIKKHKRQPLDSLLITRNYFTAEPIVSDRTSASFVRYLIDQYKIDRFLRLYRQADDLNLKQAIETVYGVTIGTLEKDWLHYLDTLTFRREQFLDQSDLAEAMFDYLSMNRFALEALARCNGRSDSIGAMDQVVRSYFCLGNYYLASSYQEKLVDLDTTSTINRMSLAGYQMMNGIYDSAFANLQRARHLDTSNQAVKFNLAVNYRARGDDSTARKYLDEVVHSSVDRSASSQARVLLADLLLTDGDPEDRKKAEQYCRESAGMWEQTVGSHNQSPITSLWIGAAYLGLGDTGNAVDYLVSAEYLETRPFFLGMINLLLGKAADLRGERNAARDFYGKVVTLPSADYHQREARRYLDHPYTR